MLSNLTVICTRAKSGYLLQVLARPLQGKSIILGSLAQDVRCCCTTHIPRIVCAEHWIRELSHFETFAVFTSAVLCTTTILAYSLIKNSSISTMDDNWEEQIKAFSAAKLRKTKTKITTPGGRKLVETRNDYGRVITDRAGDDGVGFIGDVKEDVQVGEILPGLLLGSQYLAHDYELLKKHKVTHLLGLGVIDTNIFSEIIYKGINILDMPSTDITSTQPFARASSMNENAS
ncbi:PREDICTED: dual specificity protein phosphatase 19-like, partial [Priapulus caudatus]|uniref:Dual specificity protein phosphatase 19-like n=1 Tax=Priapulus caudatus TaxID=37621 RepID=A0ABM1DUB5_PRICU